MQSSLNDRSCVKRVDCKNRVKQEITVKQRILLHNINFLKLSLTLGMTLA